MSSAWSHGTSRQHHVDRALHRRIDDDVQPADFREHAQHRAQIGPLEIEADRVARIDARIAGAGGLRRPAAACAASGCRAARRRHLHGVRDRIGLRGLIQIHQRDPDRRRLRAQAERRNRIEGRRLLRLWRGDADLAAPHGARRSAATEVEHDGVALAAHLVGDRLRQADPHARRWATQRLGGFDRHGGNRIRPVDARATELVARWPSTLRKSSRIVSGSGRDVTYPVGSLVSMTSDAPPASARAVIVFSWIVGSAPAPAAAPGRCASTASIISVKMRATPLVAFTASRPRASATACAPPAASRATADR